jgi:Cache domain
MTSRRPALNTRVLTSVLLVALPVLLVGAAIVISIGQARLRDTESARLAQDAEYTATTVDAYVFRRILDAAMLGRIPDIRRAAAEGNGAPFDQSATLKLDQQWQTNRAAASAQTGVLKSPASVFLADIVRQDPVYREVLVTDRHGRLVAASNVTSDYLQADEDWWTQAFDQGHGRIIVSDVRRDESAGVYAFEIAVPVPAPGADETAGVLKIVADSREMLAGIAGLEFGKTGEAMLVRPDGSIVFSRRSYDPKDRFFAADLLREQLAERERRKEGPAAMTFTARPESGATRVIAVAPGQLPRSYPNLNWLVALSIEQDEVLAPFQSLVWYLVIVFALTAVAVLGIALWLSLRLASPSLDPNVDLHLVEHAPMMSMEETSDTRA